MADMKEFQLDLDEPKICCSQLWIISHYTTVGCISVAFTEVMSVINSLLRIYCLVPLTLGPALYKIFITVRACVYSVKYTHHFMISCVRHHDIHALPCDKYLLIPCNAWLNMLKPSSCMFPDI